MIETHWRRWWISSIVAIVACCCGAVRPARADFDDAQYRKDLAYLASRVRALGTPGYEEAAAYLRQEIAKLPNVELREHEYSVMAPVTREATINRDDAGGRRVRV